MTTDQMENLKDFRLAPYIQLATTLIGKTREGGGNMFRHQLDTMAILVDYNYIDSVLLKASIVHDLLEDIPDFNRNHLLSIDYESHAVYELIMEVSRLPEETKAEFLTRINNNGSENAKVLKVADRISNMIALGFVNNMEFVARYITETEQYVNPIAAEVNKFMLRELETLIKSRKKYLEVFKLLNVKPNKIDPSDYY